MKSVLTVAVVVVLAALVLPAHAQWLNHPTPNIPRASNGKPNLAAPPHAARTAILIYRVSGPLGQRSSFPSPTRRLHQSRRP
jgi:hypothetical protein